MGNIYITHDLGVVAKVADYVNVMYAGKIVEKGTINEIFYDAKHPYTWGLLSAMPDLDTADERLYTIPGSPPNLLNEKQGDATSAADYWTKGLEELGITELSLDMVVDADDAPVQVLPWQEYFLSSVLSPHEYDTYDEYQALHL
jgi:ABC-type glutathione transport system ATPase component